MNRPGPARLLAALALGGALVLTGCSGDSDDAIGPDLAADGPGVAAGGAASCVAGLTYRGTFYLQVDGGGPVEAAEPLEGAEIPSCNDTGGDQEQATPIDAAAIEGVDPQFAVVAATGAGPTVHVAEDHAPGLRDAEPLPADVADTLGLG